MPKPKRNLGGRPKGETPPLKTIGFRATEEVAAAIDRLTAAIRETSPEIPPNQAMAAAIRRGLLFAAAHVHEQGPYVLLEAMIERSPAMSAYRAKLEAKRKGDK